MLRPSDYVILELGRKQIKLLAEAGNSDGKVIVVLGVFLGIHQCFGIGYVELNVAESAGACGGENLGENVDVFIAEELGIQLYDGRSGSRRSVSRKL